MWTLRNKLGTLGRMIITKAIIPVAGWGTRRLPVTKSIEKCMLPIGNRPLVDYVVQDCVAAGITEIFFVVSEGSTQLQSYYGTNTALEAYLRANGKDASLPLVQPPADVTFHYVTQPTDGKYGTAIPVALTVPHIADGESVVVLMGDDFIYNADGSSEVARLLTATPAGGSAMLCADVPRSELGRYGVVETTEANEYVRIVEHPDPARAPSTLINISKYVMNYDLLKRVEAYAATEQQGEYYIIDPMNEYVRAGSAITVLPAQGEYLDGGTLQGWLYANQVVCADIA